MAHSSGESGAGAIGRLAAIGLLLAALAAVLFHWFLFRRDNAAPVMDVSGYAVGAPADVAYAINGCWVTPRKVAVRGWIARKGAAIGRRSVRVVAIDAASGEARALRTVLQARSDIAEMLMHRLGGTDAYVLPGFVASLNLAATDQSLRGRTLHVAYDDGRVKVLIPLECRIEGTP